MQVLFSQLGFISFSHGERERERVDREFFTFAPCTGRPIYLICLVNAVFRCPVHVVWRSLISSKKSFTCFFVCTRTESECVLQAEKR